jgi:hypothetical protein
MKVTVTLTVELDREAVDAEYGVKQTAAEIREWIRAEAATATESALNVVNATVTIKESN